MIDKVENFIKRQRWKAFFFENPDANEETSENFGFKFNLSAPQNEHLIQFQNDLNDIVRTIEFNTGRNDFQKTLMSDLKKTQSSKNVLVFADKTTNLYEMSPDQYNS